MRGQGSELGLAIIGQSWVRNYSPKGMQCLLLWSWCWGARPMRPSRWKLWTSWLLNFRGWGSYAHGLSTLA
jgi:hypothetical protein